MFLVWKFFLHLTVCFFHSNTMYMSYWFLPTCKMQSLSPPLFLLHVIWLQRLMLPHMISESSVLLLVPYNICISPIQMFLCEWINYHSTCMLPLKFTWKLSSVYSTISRGHLTMVFTSLAPMISLSKHFVILIWLEIYSWSQVYYCLSYLYGAQCHLLVL